MAISEGFWNASVQEMKNGFVEEQDCFVCLLCGRNVEKGIIYPVEGVLYEAGRYIKKHIEDEHGSVFKLLSNQDKKLTGLSDHQSKLFTLFYEGKSDTEVQKEMGIGSTSTIRNHRFAFKEKERQARVFLAMMELLREGNRETSPVITPHITATMVDDRYKITEDENAKVLEKYFPHGTKGKLATFTMKEKNKIVVLREIVKRFETGRVYTEKELNEILKDIYEEDYVVLRRYLIEYGFMDRKKDCSEYWVKETPEGKKEDIKSSEGVISGIYQIRNIRNGKIFITSGRNLSKLNGPKFELNVGSYRNKELQREWKEYGEDAFVFEILESFEESENTKGLTRELKNLEKKWIEKLQPFGEKGYN